MNAYFPPNAPPQSKAPATSHLSLESPIYKTVCWLKHSARFLLTAPAGDAVHAASGKYATAVSAKPWSSQVVSGGFFAHSPLIRETRLNNVIPRKVLSLGVSLPQWVLWSLIGIEETTSPCLNIKREERAGINSLKKSLQKTAVWRGFQVYHPQRKKAIAHYLKWSGGYQRSEGVTLSGITSHLLQLDVFKNKEFRTFRGEEGVRFYSEFSHLEMKLSIDIYIMENKQIKL